MSFVPLDDLAPGMRLQAPLLNPNGVLLLKEGEVLTEKHLTIFRAWGIRGADVVQADGAAPAAPASAAVPPEVMASVRAELEARFRRADRAASPLLADIYEAVARHIAQRRAAEGRA